MISTLKKLQAKKAAQENNGGFTLIELLIVVVVLGILAAVVVFSLGGVVSSSAVAACQADGATVNTAIAAYSAQNSGVAPTAQSDLTGTSGNLQTWPANYTHYTFQLDTSGNLWLAAGSSQVAGPGSGATKGTTAAYTALPAVWFEWTGSGTCAAAGVK